MNNLKLEHPGDKAGLGIICSPGGGFRPQHRGWDPASERSWLKEPHMSLSIHDGLTLQLGPWGANRRCWGHAQESSAVSRSGRGGWEVGKMQDRGPEGSPRLRRANALCEAAGCTCRNCIQWLHLLHFGHLEDMAGLVPPGPTSGAMFMGRPGSAAWGFLLFFLHLLIMWPTDPCSGLSFLICQNPWS